MISKSGILKFIKTKYSGYEKELVDAIESGSFDLPPGAEYNRALDDIGDLLDADKILSVLLTNRTRSTIKEAIESLRKPSFSEADLSEHPSLRAIENEEEDENLCTCDACGKKFDLSLSVGEDCDLCPKCAEELIAEQKLKKSCKNCYRFTKFDEEQEFFQGAFKVGECKTDEGEFLLSKSDIEGACDQWTQAIESPIKGEESGEI